MTATTTVGDQNSTHTTRSAWHSLFLSRKEGGTAAFSCFLACVSFFSEGNTKNKTMSEDRILLPVHLAPKAYRVHLTPNIPAKTFSGSVDIDLFRPQADQEVGNSVTLHAWQLEVASASFQGTPAASISEIDETLQTFEIVFPEGVLADTGVLSLEFTGILNGDMDGFYHSVYRAPGDEKDREMCVTQFEATGARRAFPCFDEPAHKATFTVSLTVDESHTALSNMPVSDRVSAAESGTETVTFQPTVVMSTYLLAWCVFADFQCVEGVTKRGVPTRVWAPPGKREHGQFALDVSIKVLDLFSEYFDIDYPLPKLDHVALADFAAGAMENWGLITYRETALLINAEASVAQKQRVANVVAHELAHQWFGNLVTMEVKSL
jgi:puromycin-sensitive aminopeptidase